MLPERRRSRQVRRLVNVVVALAASAALLTVLSAGVGVIPGLGAALDPGHGAWASASGGKLPGSQTLHLPGLARPVHVSFTSQGIASISAASDGDLYLALGYVHAKFRLTQLDLERRLGEGRLAELAGPGAVASDKFELQLGLLRTAQREWAATPRSSPAARALTAYARGVNDYLGQVRASRQWPAAFSLAGVYPRDWTPVDSLVIQGDLTQALDFTTAPLDYSLLERSLGARTTMAWFPVIGPGPQRPFDPGPYRYRGIAPLVTNGSLATASGSGGAGGRHGGTDKGRAAASAGPAAPAGARGTAAPVSARNSARAASAILAAVRSLPSALQVHQYPASNAWAANGPKVATGGAMLAGDPHLPQTLPSVWYQVALSAPGLAVSGVSTPGLPGVLLGHNRDIAWSLTDTQNQSAVFYDEQTSKDHPGEYFWRGQWHRMQRVRYTIPVRGGAARQLTVNITAHGPVMTTAGQTVSVDWMGAVPTPDLAVLLNISKATSFAQFRAALASWRAPTENFVYADRHGHIGAIAAGYFPVVRHGDPWLPMPGTGADDVAGVIPYRAVPQVYDPPGHVVVTANQRPVGRSYPYYIGTSASVFDPGYRAAAEYRYLDRRSSMRPSSFTGLQQSVSDDLARQMVPRLVAALRGGGQLTTEQQEARGLLATWDYTMDDQSAAASLWWTFWTDYLSAVFQPWWTARRVPVHRDRFGLELGPGQFSLDEVLASWTLHDPGNAAFSPPGSGRHPNAAAVMRTAFASAVTELHGQLGGGASSWSWGRLHRTKLNSLIPGAALGYGPRASGGDPWTPDAAYGGLTSSAGATWRMVVSWPNSGSGSGQPAGVASYPGGQSENPASPWYDNLVAGWWAGRYQPMPVAGPVATGAAGAAGSARAARSAGAGSASGAGGAARAGGSAGAIRWELLP